MVLVDPLLLLQPAGLRSGAGVAIDLEDSCTTSTKGRRFEVPVAKRIIGAP
jgi:hypothetical protein